MSVKGQQIRFAGGTYNGKSGWINVAKKETSCFYQVIVCLDNTTNKTTIVRKEHVRSVQSTGSESTFGQAVLNQHSDVEAMMENLVRSLAQCDVATDSAEVVKIFSDKLSDAIRAQMAKGSKARWRSTHFDRSNNSAQV